MSQQAHDSRLAAQGAAFEKIGRPLMPNEH
jgi:hypothetical protein